VIKKGIVSKVFGLLFIVLLSPVLLVLLLLGIGEVIYAIPVVGWCIAAFVGFMLMLVGKAK
jgi:hypothetical protein